MAFEQLGPGDSLYEKPTSFCWRIQVLAFLETRWRLGRVNFRKDFWDCYRGQGETKLANSWLARPRLRSHKSLRKLTRPSFLPKRPFPSSPAVCIKTRLSAQPLIWKWFFILMQIKLIFTRKVVHLASLWKWGFWNSEVARCTKFYK